MSAKRHKCYKKRVNKNFIEDTVATMAMQMFEYKKLINRIVDNCFELQNGKNTRLPALKKQLKQTKKEIENVMNAVKAGLVTKSTKSTLESLELEQENLEIAIVKEQIERPTITKEQIIFWIMKFAKTDITNTEQRQRLIDVFVNAVYVYDDKMVITFNYKDGDMGLTFDEINLWLKNKENTPINGCSPLLKLFDPYGSRMEKYTFCYFS